jgi:quinol monooxygenase YgiN
MRLVGLAVVLVLTLFEIRYAEGKAVRFPDLAAEVQAGEGFDAGEQYRNREPKPNTQEGRRMFANRSSLSLLLLALFSFAGESWAQATQQYVVVYVEFLPGEVNSGEKLVGDLALQSLTSNGVINFSAVQQADRPSKFALIERWSSAQVYQAYKASSTWTTFVANAQPLLAAPLDERPGVLLAQ